MYVTYTMLSVNAIHFVAYTYTYPLMHHYIITIHPSSIQSGFGYLLEALVLLHVLLKLLKDFSRVAINKFKESGYIYMLVDQKILIESIWCSLS